MSRSRMPGGMKEHEQLRDEIDSVLNAPQARPGSPDLAGTGHGGRDIVLTATATACGLSAAEAERTVRVVLAALSDRITPDEARHLAAQLPEPWKRVVAKPRREVVQKMDREQLVGRVCRDLALPVPEGLRRCRAVYAGVEQQVSRGETRQVLLQLPPELREVFKPRP
jgi:uncharacterized protein (DUF2267 family)